MAEVIPFTRQPSQGAASKRILSRRDITARLVDLLADCSDAGDDVAFDAIHDAWAAIHHASKGKSS